VYPPSGVRDLLTQDLFNLKVAELTENIDKAPLRIGCSAYLFILPIAWIVALVVVLSIQASFIGGFIGLSISGMFVLFITVVGCSLITKTQNQAAIKKVLEDLLQKFNQENSSLNWVHRDIPPAGFEVVIYLKNTQDTKPLPVLPPPTYQEIQNPAE
jgi:hypothetical protein